jgi:hypothetical protein
MTDDSEQFAHHVTPPGSPTSQSLAEILGVPDEGPVNDRLREELERIRVSEQEAERVASHVRLY